MLDLTSLPEGYGLQFRFRSNDTLAVFDRVTLQSAASSILLGDVNQDGIFSFLDIFPFISVLANAGFQDEADMNLDGVANFLDINFFIVWLSAQ